jgi:hypothetical protein
MEKKGSGGLIKLAAAVIALVAVLTGDGEPSAAESEAEKAKTATEKPKAEVSDGTGAEETAASKAITALSDVLKLVISAVAIVYVAGGAVMWVRLRHEGVPTDPVVSALPREFLISIGLRTIVAPALAYAAVGLGLYWVSRKVRGHFGLQLLVAFVLGAGLIVISVLIAAFVLDRNWWTVGLLIGLGVTLFVGWALNLRVDTTRPMAVKRVNTTRATPVVTAVVIATGFGGIAGRVFVEALDDTSAPTTVCVKDAKATFQGDYIGETDKTIYLADGANHAIVSIPKDRAAETHVAEEGAEFPDAAEEHAEFPPCEMSYPLPQPPAGQPPAPQPPAGQPPAPQPPATPRG